MYVSSPPLTDVKLYFSVKHLSEECGDGETGRPERVVSAWGTYSWQPPNPHLPRDGTRRCERSVIPAHRSIANGTSS